MSSWVLSCCTDTGLSDGMHLGWPSYIPGVGIFQRACFVLDCGFAKTSTWAFPCVSFKGKCLLQIEGGLVSSWFSSYCTDTGISADMHLG